jgi:hypothetical protein
VNRSFKRMEPSETNYIFRDKSETFNTEYFKLKTTRKNRPYVVNLTYIISRGKIARYMFGTSVRGGPASKSSDIADRRAEYMRILEWCSNFVLTSDESAQ